VFDRARLGREIMAMQKVTPANVRAEAPHKKNFFNAGYYEDKQNKDVNILLVQVVLKFVFVSKDRDWTTTEQEQFVSGFKSAAYKAWAGKYQIRSSVFQEDGSMRYHAMLGRDTCSVEFEILSNGDEKTAHWVCKVQAIPVGGHATSWVDYYNDEINKRVAGTALLDSEDLKERALTPEASQTSYRQRGVVHEFGHMLGLRDEYAMMDGQVVSNANPHHTGSYDSIMNMGEKVYPRHYALLAHWLTQRNRAIFRDFDGFADLDPNYCVVDAAGKELLPKNAKL
jgi:hypothetical protein